MKKLVLCPCGCYRELEKDPVPFNSEGHILLVNRCCHPDFVGNPHAPVNKPMIDLVECPCGGGWDLIS